MDYQKLENSLIDVIKEEQAKLGYRKEEIRLYYPLGSLNHFFDTNGNEEEMPEFLRDSLHIPKNVLVKCVTVIAGSDFAFSFLPREVNMCIFIHPKRNSLKNLLRLWESMAVPWKTSGHFFCIRKRRYTGKRLPMENLMN